MEIFEQKLRITSQSVVIQCRISKLNGINLIVWYGYKIHYFHAWEHFTFIVVPYEIAPDHAMFSWSQMAKRMVELQVRGKIYWRLHYSFRVVNHVGTTELLLFSIIRAMICACVSAWVCARVYVYMASFLPPALCSPTLFWFETFENIFCYPNSLECHSVEPTIFSVFLTKTATRLANKLFSTG